MAWYDDNSHLWGNEEYDEAMEGDDCGILRKYTYGNPRIQHSKTCRACGETGLAWKSIEGKWRLVHGDTVHVCKIAPAPEHYMLLCPFCGSDETRVGKVYSEPEVGICFDRWAVGCISCGAIGPCEELTMEKAIDRWNLRVQNDEE